MTKHTPPYSIHLTKAQRAMVDALRDEGGRKAFDRCSIHTAKALSRLGLVEFSVGTGVNVWLTEAGKVRS